MSNAPGVGLSTDSTLWLVALWKSCQRIKHFFWKKEEKVMVEFGWSWGIFVFQLFSSQSAVCQFVRRIRKCSEELFGQVIVPKHSQLELSHQSVPKELFLSAITRTETNNTDYWRQKSTKYIFFEKSDIFYNARGAPQTLWQFKSNFLNFCSIFWIIDFHVTDVWRLKNFLKKFLWVFQTIFLWTFRIWHWAKTLITICPKKSPVFSCSGLFQIGHFD